MNTFSESQRMFDSTFNKIIIGLVIVLLGKLIYNNVTQDFQPVSLVSIVILIFSICIFILFRVYTTISQEGVNVLISPFKVYHKHYKWNEIKKIEVVKYAPLKEYGGWGFRRSKNGLAINPSGDRGIKLHLKDGKVLLIGTRKADEIQSFLKTLK